MCGELVIEFMIASLVSVTSASAGGPSRININKVTKRCHANFSYFRMNWLLRKRFNFCVFD